jgi:hypothetical protein
MFVLPRRVSLLTSIGLALVGVVGIWFSARSVAGATGTEPISPATASSPAATTEASLHNPTFDNHDWYFFYDRYDPTYPDGPDASGQPILPDDDNNQHDNIPSSILQDWRLWYLRDTPLIQTFVEEVLVQSVEAVAVRTYDGDVHQGGLYQIIYSTTPCLLYSFQMYGRSQPDPGENPSSSLQVGIDQLGWRPDSKTDPAVPSPFPATTVWGPAHDYKRTYGPLTVTAEARADKLTVFTYADAVGGRRHAIVWDTGSFADVTPGTIHDPDDLPAPSIADPTVTSVNDSTATIEWTTANDALGQVYYRLRPSEITTPTTYSNTVYLPLVISPTSIEWLASSLNKTHTTNHTATLTDLQPNRTYEYQAVSRGLLGDTCTTWVSEILTFTTTP